jgi:membrane dipeptidase
MEAEGLMNQVTGVGQLDQTVNRWLNRPLADDSLSYSHSRPSTDSESIGYVLSLEGADSIVTLDHLHQSFASGLRAIGPAHYGPGRYAFGTDAGSPLTAEGGRLIDEIQSLGLILDVTHLCDQTFWDVMDRYSGPLWASHQNTRRFAPWNRQFADDQILAVIQRQGLLGMAFDAIMLVPGWKHLESRPSDFDLRLESICDHIDHICQLAGSSKNVCIGSDLDGGYGTEQTPKDLNSIADLHRLSPLLERRGFSCQDIQGIFFRNAVDFLRRVWTERGFK